jgi:pullulanase
MEAFWPERPTSDTAGKTDANEASTDKLSLRLELPCSRGIARHELALKRGQPLSFSYDEEGSLRVTGGARAERLASAAEAHLLRPRYGSLRDISLAKPRLTPWNGAARAPDYLEKLILDGRYDAGAVSSLADWFGSEDFALRYHSDEELGALWAPEDTEFRLWAPTAARVALLLWERGDGGGPQAALPMKQAERGVWKLAVKGDLHGRYYGYRVRAHGIERETIDPYARSAGLNGKRGMVLDPARACPPGWEAFSAPACPSPNDAVVWEAHVRDLTSKPSWTGPEEKRYGYRGACHPGTDLAVPASALSAATAAAQGQGSAIPTGFDHVKALGVTHVQLLPVFDFVSVDESRAREPAYRTLRERGAYNWGYDPCNYAAPEGSYASDPADGSCRVRELRELVRAYGEAGIGIVMDVVYNHVPDLRLSALEACVPGYYFRGRRDSGAGDDTASERFMFRRYMADTLCWWLEGYKLSGFRFDLMGLHDLRAMRYIEKRLRAIKPDLLLYGEGWDMYRGGDKGFEPASQKNFRRLPGYGMFNDAFRDGVKGSVFDAGRPGWLHGGADAESVKFGIVGAVRHPQLRNRLVAGTAMPKPWGERSAASVNYVEVHDNLTLRDKLELVEPGRGDEYYARLLRLALTLTLTAQGMPLLHAGMEFLRSKRFPADWLADGLPDKAVCLPGSATGTKPGLAEGVGACFCHDSYKFSDELNGLEWSLAARHRDSVAYLSALIALRKKSPCLRLPNGADIRRLLRFYPAGDALLAWGIAAGREGGLFIAANARDKAARIRLPRGVWRLVADSAAAAFWPSGGACIKRFVELPAKGALILERQA